MRSLSQQDESGLGGALSVLVRQKRDHQRLDELIGRLELAERDGSDEEREAAMSALCRLVFPHAFAEESVLWPELRRVLPDGEELTLQVEREHQEVNELVVRLEQPATRGAARQRLVARLVEVLREDVRDEEDLLLPRLQTVVPRRRLQQLGVAWEAVRRTAPTRPHPRVSRRPPGNALAAVPLSVLDRGRDLIDAAARRVPEGPAAHLRAASRAVAGMAGRVEQTAVVRRGEDPGTSR